METGFNSLLKRAHLMTVSDISFSSIIQLLRPNNGMHWTPATRPLTEFELGAGDAERYAAGSVMFLRQLLGQIFDQEINAVGDTSHTHADWDIRLPRMFKRHN